MGFSERLKAERLKKGLKQRELASLVKTTNTSISNWEKGLSRPSASVVSLLARALEVSPFDLLGDYSLNDIKQLNSKDTTELSYEDSMALTFSVDVLKETGIALNGILAEAAVDLNRNIKDLGSAMKKACWDMLLADGGEQLLLAYNSLNRKGKALLVEYLSGILKVPTYLEESEFGVDEEQISELYEVKHNLENALETGCNSGK